MVGHECWNVCIRSCSAWQAASPWRDRWGAHPGEESFDQLLLFPYRNTPTALPAKWKTTWIMSHWARAAEPHAHAAWTEMRMMIHYAVWFILCQCSIIFHQHVYASRARLVHPSDTVEPTLAFWPSSTNFILSEIWVCYIHCSQYLLSKERQ